MSQILSIRIDAEMKQRLDVLAKQTNRSKSYLAAAAISAYVDSEEWQLDEVHRGIADLDSGEEVGHGEVKEWLRSWGKADETKAPR